MPDQVRLPVLALVFSTVLVVSVRGGAGQDAAVQLQIGSLLFEETRYAEALQAFRKAAESDESSISVPARIGVVKSALRIGEFTEAQQEAHTLLEIAPENAEVLTVHADALWSAGAFDEAESEYLDALSRSPGMSRALHGTARSLASRNHLDEAMDAAQAALRDAPRDPEIHHTVGAIFERMHRFEQAAAAYTNYVNLLPNKDRSEKAAWSRAQVRFLKSFGERQPIALDDESVGQLHTVDFRLVDDKVIVQARVNGQRPQDFVLDTGSEQTTISRRSASTAGVRPITTRRTLTRGAERAGVSANMAGP